MMSLAESIMVDKVLSYLKPEGLQQLHLVTGQRVVRIAVYSIMTRGHHHANEFVPDIHPKTLAEILNQSVRLTKDCIQDIEKISCAVGLMGLTGHNHFYLKHYSREGVVEEGVA